MKWIVRADCRPPKRSSSQGATASKPGDMVSPVATIAGQQHDDDAEIGELLQGVVAARLLALGKAQPGVLLDFVEEMARRELVAGGKEIPAEMTGRNAVGEIGQAVEDEGQAKKKCHRRPAARSW